MAASYSSPWLPLCHGAPAPSSHGGAPSCPSTAGPLSIPMAPPLAASPMAPYLLLLLSSSMVLPLLAPPWSPSSPAPCRSPLCQRPPPPAPPPWVAAAALLTSPGLPFPRPSSSWKQAPVTGLHSFTHAKRRSPPVLLPPHVDGSSRQQQGLSPSSILLFPFLKLKLIYPIFNVLLQRVDSALLFICLFDWPKANLKKIRGQKASAWSYFEQWCPKDQLRSKYHMEVPEVVFARRS
ncbi:hypothetical protein BS78_10G148800 [Paspalum vaginatum]|nr:hypothetical protein BS78_10G148800 [Paspalum vaginatum]